MAPGLGIVLGIGLYVGPIGMVKRKWDRINQWSSDNSMIHVLVKPV